MPLAGKGMLLTSMDVDAVHEAEFNHWYDREHIAERVAIDGFLEARRYAAVNAAPRYLGLYSTATFEVLSSPAYKQALAHQTEWSRTNLARFRNMIRAVARITASRGQGRGAALAMWRLRVAPNAREAIRARLAAAMKPGDTAGLISIHLLESDPALSVSLTNPDPSDPGASDWFVLVDGTDVDSVAAAAEDRLRPILSSDAQVVSRGTYRLQWDLAKSDL